MKKRYFLQLGLGFGAAYGLSKVWPKGLWPTAIASGRQDPGTLQAFSVQKTEAEWRRLLTPEQYHVLRDQGTERAGSSSLDKEYRPGTYYCVGCDLALFDSKTKFNSHTGWPSFYAPIEGAIATQLDQSGWIEQTEVHCSRCGGHLGHVFIDGPPPTGKRYCINGVALRFAAASNLEPPAS